MGADLSGRAGGGNARATSAFKPPPFTGEACRRSVALAPTGSLTLATSP